MSFLLPSCEEIPSEALPASDTISSPKSDMPASELFISKGLLNILQTVSSCSRYTTFFLFGSRFRRQNLPIPKRFRSDLRTNLSLNADVLENTLLFVSQSINNFSDYDKSQTHEWGCPSLSPHVLLDPDMSKKGNEAWILSMIELLLWNKNYLWKTKQTTRLLTPTRERKSQKRTIQTIKLQNGAI